MNKIEEVLTRGIDEVIIKDSLEKRLNSGKKLIVKLGIDPTGADLHLGHAVVLRKLREFQDLGHHAVLVIGDFTAKIGDPSGRTEERKSLSDKEIKQNMATYKKQAGKILDIDKVQFINNSTWFNRLGLTGVLELASKATYAQIFERKELRERLNQNTNISYLEMLYPLMQGYDSVELKADVELGGTDQKFNLLMGRQIQKRYGQKEQDIVIMKLLPGTDGAKMSKSAENYISILADPSDMYGKIMSISDDLILGYFELCTNLPLDDLNNIRKKIEEGDNIFELKKQLAGIIVQIYHGEKASIIAADNFKKVFQEGKYQEGFLIHKTIDSGIYKPADIPVVSGGTTSLAQSKELFRQGAVEIDGKIPKISDWSKSIELKPGQVIQIGKKRIIKVKDK